MHLTLNQISKTFTTGALSRPAVMDVSLEAHGGEIFGILGPNGAGKTTMIRMVLDILRPDSGEILIDGNPTFNRTQAFRRSLGYLPEERGLYKKRTTLEILIYFAALKGIKKRDAIARAETWLNRLGLSQWINHNVDNLSKGMSQKVQLASCLLHDPSLVILDEPFSGLDPLNIRIVRELILELKAEGKLVVLCTHRMAEVEALCDRILMMYRGKSVLYGSLSEIKQKFSHGDLTEKSSISIEDIFVNTVGASE